jgi:hypothetical protein
MAPMVSGLVLQKKGVTYSIAHGPVLDEDFPQDGMIAIFIVAVM